MVATHSRPGGAEAAPGTSPRPSCSWAPHRSRFVRSAGSSGDALGRGKARVPMGGGAPETTTAALGCPHSLEAGCERQPSPPIEHHHATDHANQHDPKQREAAPDAPVPSPTASPSSRARRRKWRRISRPGLSGRPTMLLASRARSVDLPPEN